ncbi:d-isomer specific 2-hydroxyacid dehydrogenase, NAD binding domain-containing protein [Trichoderma breve]|uniref:D-isomer specific 2-hydroxyacid dehydrogenase, NAD binding domain-containing protein n=1 Tax=Trichoderma breve TaxID=2034170 RepID=A0A9W9B7X2_9HYPO|nr:d-isomer specific 2-hydroxyacid dehydrogenase, NAD binding domain-containing protein [Trichoderma breve]KAJ4856329.1 d-isomer specific 2-hydroxyacid dehydrogenase, NAD binding domain-containing protein [Trichoderma breve]
MFPSTVRQSIARLPKRPSLAIIDDYLNTSESHFAHIPTSSLQVTTFNDTITPINEAETARLVERLKPFEAISTMRERTAFSGSLLRSLPNLKLLLATGTQFETFDLAAARELGITVVAAPGGVHPTTQHAWALIMALSRNVAADDAVLKTGTGWQTELAIGLTGLTIGIVGLGRLGAAVARIGHLAWGMKVLCWNTFHAVSKEHLFCNSDVVSLHYVLSDRSRGIVGANELQQMKSSAMLINTSREPLIDQAALLNSLERGAIRGAALDVFEIEPLPMYSPWRRTNYWGRDGRSRLITTPHMGYMDERLVNAWYAETAENIDRWLEGKEVLHRIA